MKTILLGLFTAIPILAQTKELGPRDYPLQSCTGLPPTGYLRLCADIVTGNLICINASGGSCNAGGTGGGATITPLTYSCANQQGGGSFSNVSCTWSTRPPSGASVLCGVATFTTGTTGFSVTDGTNTYTNTNAGGSATYVPGFGNTTMAVFRFLGLSALAPTTVTFSFTGVTDGFPVILCNAFTDTGTTPAADGNCSGTTAVSTTLQCSTAITTTGNDYVFGFANITGTTHTAGTGWTMGSNVSGGSGGLFNEYQVQTSPGSINPNFNITSGVNSAVLGVAVKP